MSGRWSLEAAAYTEGCCKTQGTYVKLS